MPPMTPEGTPEPTLPPIPELTPNAKIINLYDYFKNIAANEGMESITHDDAVLFESVFEDVKNNLRAYKRQDIQNLLTLIEQLAASECFLNRDDKDRVLTNILRFREEWDD